MSLAAPPLAPPWAHQAPDTRPLAPATQEPIAPGLVHIEVDPDATYVAGHLDARDTAKAREILTYLRDRGVLVTASAEEIMLVIARPIAPALLARTEAKPRCSAPPWRAPSASDAIVSAHRTAGAGPAVTPRPTMARARSGSPSPTPRPRLTATLRRTPRCYMRHPAR